MLRELAEVATELQRGQTALPDLFVEARDGNCQGHAACARQILEAVQDYSGQVVAAVPDPHVERWLLIDAQAFKKVLGQGCQAPDQKCDRDRYKGLLDAAVRAAGVQPLLGGVEFAEDIISAMTLPRAERADASFASAVRDLRAAFNRWRSE